MLDVTPRGCFFYGCFLVIEAQVLCQRQRPNPAKGPVQGYDPLSDSAQIGPPLIRRGIPGSL